MRLIGKFFILAALTGCIISFTSCLSNETTSTTERDGNCAVTSVTLGNLPRTIYTKTATGNDTAYTAVVAGSAYPMYIDQLKQEIYNPDSLPINTNVSKIVFSAISADGDLYYHTASGQETLYTSTDTLDFSKPVYFTCRSSDGEQSRTYLVKVNVHQSQSEAFSWTTAATANEAFNGVTAQRMFIMGQELVVVAVKDGLPTVMRASTTDASVWNTANIAGLSQIAPEEVVMFDGKLYYADNFALKCSANGTEWSAIDTNQPVERIVGVGKNEVFAIANGQIYSSTDLIQWQIEETNDDIAQLPAQNVVSTWADMTFNSNFYYTMIGGADKNGHSVIWKKITDIKGVNTEAWTLYPQTEETKHAFPQTQQTILLNYDAKQIAFGLANGQLSPFYISTDAGRSWIEQTGSYNLPQGIEATSFSAALDADNHIWLATAPEGKVICGRLNRLSYDKNQTVFLKSSLR